MARHEARERIRKAVEKWLFVEPLFLSVWTMHELIVNPRIATLRVGRGRVEYNPAFIDTLDTHQLDAVLMVESMRIVLKHPYTRKKPHAELAYLASNITLQEYLDTQLPLPRARDVFGAERAKDLKRQYFELYYAKLLEEASDSLAAALGSGAPESGAPGSDAPGSDAPVSGESSGADGKPDGLSSYSQPRLAGAQNTELWDADDLFASAVNEKITEVFESQSWGTITGRHRERILATLRPKLDYRAVLRQFRTSVLSIHRRLTRMKPNRRYGYLYMGSRYDFTTKLLVAVDVSGSMSSDDVTRGFSVINRFFKYGVRSVDVIQFDTEIQGPALNLKRAQREITIQGRGGTNFDPVMEYIDEHTDYDGLIVFTDGYAPVPRPPKNRATRVLWLFTHEHSYSSMRDGLRPIGRTAYLREG